MSLLTARVEGGLLSPDFLEAVHEAPGQKPADFGLDPRRPLIDEIAAVWSDVRAYWEAFERRRARARDGESLTTATREAWVIPLLEALGYNLTYQRKALSADGRSFNISHRAGTRGEGDKTGKAGAGDGDESGPPVHIVAIDQKLGERPPSGHGTASPHALVQDYLNRSDELWGIVTNGAVLRLLRDSVYFSRPAYIEFDLQAMVEGERLDEFILLYRLAHRSRLPVGDDCDGCLLEQYYQSAVEQGGRIRDGLRQAVEAAILTLANGFLAHRANGALVAALAADSTAGHALSPNGFYQQLLYLIYRLIFLMAAEERNLLRLPAANAGANGGANGSSPVGSTDPSGAAGPSFYADHYSIARLRRLADAPLNSPQRFDDLYLGLRTLFEILRDETLAAKLSIPALNGELFDPDRMAHLETAHLNNRDLLDAVRELSHFTPADERVRRRVNYAALDVEELGSVYESLLDEHPVLIREEHKPPQFAFVHGSERKTTGSYYTARALVKETLDASLDPVIEERLAAAGEARGRRASTADLRAAQKDALLALRVCDSACGSGHFLLAAARRIGRRLAQVDTGEDEPAPEAVRRWTRQAIIHCIYGVDKNPLAVDLCKVALWIEGNTPGKPLTFLDAHIKCGDSLVGVFDLAALDGGIPDDAFKPLTGDDKRVATGARARNRQERTAGQTAIALAGDQAAMDALAQQWRAELTEADEDTPAQVRKKRAAYSRLQAAERERRLLCDLWTAAFFTPLTPANEAQGRIVTSAVLHSLRGDPAAASAQLAGWAQAVAAENRFFHWPLEFPHVFGARGFDVMLGNPPWERIKLQEQEFFAARDPQIAAAPNKAARQKLIERLPRENPALAAAFTKAKYGAEAQSRFVRVSGRFPLTAVGDVNTYALFAELVRGLLAPAGRAGIIVPTGIATDDTTKAFFADLMESRNLVQLMGFENEAFIFPAVHHAFKFCTLTITGAGATAAQTDFAFFCRDFEQTRQSERHFVLSYEDIALINPNTRTCAIFRTGVDAELTKAIYEHVPVLYEDRSHNKPWPIILYSMLHMANDSDIFQTQPYPGLLPLYEAKMVWQYDHRFGSFDGREERGFTNLEPVATEKLQDADWQPAPYYWVPEVEVLHRLVPLDDETRKAVRALPEDEQVAFLRPLAPKWLMGFRDITNAGNERTAAFAILPRTGVGHNLSLLIPQLEDSLNISSLLANMNSLIFDYVTRQKIAGSHMSFYMVKQLPVLPPLAYDADDLTYIVPRVLELTYTAWDLAPFAADVWAGADDGLRTALLAQHAANRAATGGHGWDPPAWADLPPQPPDDLPLSPFRWDDERRAQLRAELDAYYARLYGLRRDDLRYILDPKEVHGPDFPGETFRVLKEKEERQHGEYRTRRLVLAAFDRLEAALGPAPVRDYRAELAAAPPAPTDAEPRPPGENPSSADAPDLPPRPQFGSPRAKDGPTAAPPANQPDLFGPPPDQAPAPAPAAPAPATGEAARRPPPAAQPALIPSPPQGTRVQRINRIMALGKLRTPEAIGELVAALGDEDDQLRWLASMALQTVGGGVVRATLRAYAAGDAPEAGREEAVRLLEQMAGAEAEGGQVGG